MSRLTEVSHGEMPTRVQSTFRERRYANQQVSMQRSDGSGDADREKSGVQDDCLTDSETKHLEDHLLKEDTDDADSRGESIYDTAEWRLACRVAASKGLSKSALLPKFLLYICEQSLRGKAHHLNEQRIGTSIFLRAPAYNPGEDNIVRSYARTLRRRLEDYFEGEGKDEPVRIVIARGGYVPRFEARFAADADRSEVQPSSPAVSSTLPAGGAFGSVRSAVVAGGSTFAAGGVTLAGESGSEIGAGKKVWRGFRSHWVMPWCCFLAGLCVAWVGFGLQRSRARRPQSPSHMVWAQIFQHSRDTLIVPADSGLGILQNLSGHLISLEEYANGSYLSDSHGLPGYAAASLVDLRQQRYTSLVDLKIATRLTQLPEFIAERTEIRFARSITTEDLKTSNVILLGSRHSNPWVALFEDKLNFRLQYMPAVNQSFVVNTHPLKGEQNQYFNGTGANAEQTYSVIDYLPNLDGSGHVLIIQGLNMAATQAAAEALFSSDVMAPILKQAVGENQNLRPFELLIKTRSVGATASDLQVIAVRIHV